MTIQGLVNFPATVTERRDAGAKLYIMSAYVAQYVQIRIALTLGLLPESKGVHDESRRNDE